MHQHPLQCHSSIWNIFFKKYQQPTNCSEKIKNLFLTKKIPIAPNQCYPQSFRLLTATVYQIRHWCKEVKGRILNFKNWAIVKFTWNSTSVSTSFVQNCWKFLKQKGHYLLNDCSYGWVLYVNRMVEQLFWWSESEILKTSNFGCGRWVSPNDDLIRQCLQGNRYYFCKNFHYGHDLNVNRIW